PLPDPGVVIDESDQCGIIHVEFESDTDNKGQGCLINPYIVLRKYRVTDDCGNSTAAIQTITVIDNTPPIASHPLPVNVQCITDIPEPDPSVVTDESDNCGEATVTHLQDVPTGAGCPGDPYIVTRTYRIADDCGNHLDVTQILTAID